ncbi:unnamed protein product [Dovyalis caffra]|uniref:Uncharacterized protein n=1 Tax=Dovyalis caffra TaxID=77055 RepID=A0AAV1RXF0_9ROSI|nr:unnamed protein product [Dovyalis caffra]
MDVINGTNSKKFLMIIYNMRQNVKHTRIQEEEGILNQPKHQCVRGACARSREGVVYMCSRVDCRHTKIQPCKAKGIDLDDENGARRASPWSAKSEQDNERERPLIA